MFMKSDHQPSASREIELRIALDDEIPILEGWLRLHATKTGERHETDHYYEFPDRPFVTVSGDGSRDADEWLRVRTSSSGGSLCYKKWYRDVQSGRSLWADEFEVSIGDSVVASELLARLGLREIAVVAKRRVEWTCGEFIVDFDQVENLGSFVEIEYKGQITNSSQGRAEIVRFLRRIGLTKWRVARRGYPWQLWNPHLDPFEPPE